MRTESDEHEAENERNFRDTLFSVNPDLYFQMYPPDDHLTDEEEDEIEWIVPENEGDVKRMLAELGKAGWNG